MGAADSWNGGLNIFEDRFAKKKKKGLPTHWGRREEKFVEQSNLSINLSIYLCARVCVCVCVCVDCIDTKTTALGADAIIKQNSSTVAGITLKRFRVCSSQNPNTKPL